MGWYLKKIFKYFIYRPIDRLIFYTAIKTKKNFFVFFFNVLAFLNKSSNKIYYKDGYYYNKEIAWRFFHRKQGLYAYSNGFLKRKQELLSNYLISNLEFNDKDIIIDVGANNGDFYLCFNKKIQYYAFEPSPKVYSNLIYNIKNQNLYNLGVSNQEKKNIKFYLNDEFGDSSIIPMENYTEVKNIQTITLDSIISKIQKKIKLIKIEAEGFEPEVLEGLKKYIRNVEYITIDCGFERGVNKDSTISECSNYLIKNNFEMINFSSARTICLFKNSDLHI